MCEHYVARSAEPFRLDELWPFTERLERFGVAGFGWGAAWLGEDGRLHSHRDVRAFRDDPEGAAAVGAQETTAALVHLRRPSKLSTLPARPTRSHSMTRPGASPSATTATCATPARLRATYRAQGRIHGRADTEVGARWLEDAWRDDEPAAHLLAALHDQFGGQANLAVLAADGRRPPLRRQRREPGLHVPPGRDRDRLDRDLLAGPLRVPVRRAGCYGASPGATSRRSRWTVTGGLPPPS